MRKLRDPINHFKSRILELNLVTSEELQVICLFVTVILVELFVIVEATVVQLSFGPAKGLATPAELFTMIIKG